jgi:Bacteriophage probable baseplate hub protein
VAERDDQTRATGIKVTCGADVPPGDVTSFIVDGDLGQADMCVLTLKNDEHKYSNEKNPGDAVEVKVITAAGEKSIFKGEVVSIEPVYKVTGETRVVIRCYHKLHRMLRGRKSRTFQDKSDNAIIKEVVDPYGVAPTVGSKPQVAQKHVYQHNQTDFEFVRLRAARLGFDIWIEDTGVVIDAIDLNKKPVADLKMGDSDLAHRIKSFAPRLSSAQIVSKVIVRGWDPEKKEKIEKEVSVEATKMGAQKSDAASSSFGETKVYTVDVPVCSPAEAEAIGKAKIGELAMGFITGEGECVGNPDLRVGNIVNIVVNANKQDDRFNGKYLLTGVSHRYVGQQPGATGGYNTTIRVSRNAQKGQ